MESLIDDDMTMDQIMRRWPLTIRVVIRSGMLCVGCPIASFHGVADAAREHGLDEDLLRSDLETAASSGSSASPMSSASDLRPA
ncbi:MULTISPECIES: DUF1858 domain-containing protein [unclassified Mesorhizobium]|uniref:DUF1858 domain-containing protein n=1 Tax=unclassified Mesorhizobium TaxID=325217 RepID=UPI0009E92DEC|nr:MULTISPECIES: DUF1858 domain-containing protein [unclassified Mesorhizobium]